MYIFGLLLLGFRHIALTYICIEHHWACAANGSRHGQHDQLPWAMDVITIGSRTWHHEQPANPRPTATSHKKSLTGYNSPYLWDFMGMLLWFVSNSFFFLSLALSVSIHGFCRGCPWELAKLGARNHMWLIWNIMEDHDIWCNTSHLNSERLVQRGAKPAVHLLHCAANNWWPADCTSLTNVLWVWDLLMFIWGYGVSMLIQTGPPASSKRVKLGLRSEWVVLTLPIFGPYHVS